MLKKYWRAMVAVAGVVVAAGAFVVQLSKLYDWLGKACQFLLTQGTSVDPASKAVRPHIWLEVVLATLVLFFLGFWGLVWKLFKQQTDEPKDEPKGQEYTSLLAKHNELNTGYGKAQEMIGGMMAATSRIRNQLAPSGRLVKSFKRVRITYYVHRDFTADVVRESDIYANQEPVHFWTAGYHPTAYADKVDYLKDINFEVVDGNESRLPYLPIKNDPLAKDVVIYFLPRIEALSMRSVRISFTWPGYLRQLNELGWENFAFSLESIDPIPSLDFCWYLEPGTGKNLVGEVLSDRLAGDRLDLSASVSYRGNVWRGFSYKVMNGPSGSFKYEVRARLKAP